MTKGRMADIMRQTQRFCQILIQPQSSRDHAADLGHFETMCQPGAIMVAIGSDKDLRLGAEAAERDGMDDPVTITLKLGAGAARPFPVFGKFSAP